MLKINLNQTSLISNISTIPSHHNNKSLKLKKICKSKTKHLTKFRPIAQAIERNNEAQKKKPGAQTITKTIEVKKETDNGIFWLCLANTIIFVLDKYFKIAWIKNLYLYHNKAKWWQYITHAFCHANWAHFSSNMFLLYIFGKLVEEEEGLFGLWFVYCLCAFGGSLAGVLLLPKNAVSIGASAAVFGLFAVSVLLKLSWNIKKLLEAGILGQYVVNQVINEIQLMSKKSSMLSSGTQISHVAHIGGALMGALLILALKQIPDIDDELKPKTEPDIKPKAKRGPDKNNECE